MRNVFENNLGTMSAYDLILKLDKDYPHRCLSVDADVNQAHRYAGKRDLVDSLLSQIKHEDNR